MSGPWEKYATPKPQDSDAQTGPWTKYESKPSDVGGAVEAGIEHFGNAATFGYLPQIQAAVSKIIPDPNSGLDEKLKAQGFTIKQNDPTFIQDRDAYIRHLQDQERNHPVASAVGTVGGALASGVATSGLMPINAASKLGRVGQAAKAGAIIGAISNPGDKEGEISGLQLGDRAIDSAGGAAIGGAGQGIIEGLSSAAKGVTNLSNSLTNKAEERAFKASGAMLKDYRNAASKDRINVIGRYMLDNDLVKPGMTVGDIAEQAEKLKTGHGQAIGNILESLDQSGAAAPSHEMLASHIEEIANPMKNLNTAKPTYNALQDVASDIRTMGGGAGEGATESPASFSSAQKVKSFIDDQIKKSGGWNAPNPTEKNLALREAYSKVNSLIESAADQAASGSGDKELLQNYLNNKAGYRNAIEVSKIAKDQSLRQNANNFFSLGDKLGASAGFAGGFASGDGIEDRLKKGAIGASIGLGSKLARTYGTPLVSTALDKAGSSLSKSILPEIGEMIAPALMKSERGVSAPSVVQGLASTPRLDTSAISKVADSDSSANRSPSGNIKGEAKWAMDGMQKLGLSDEALLQDKKSRQLLIEASDLKADSKRLQAIKNQLSRGNK